MENIAKTNRIFPGKEGGDKPLILTYLDSLMAEVFPQYCLFFSILAIFRGKLGSKLSSKFKVLNLGLSIFYKNSNPSKCFQTMFLFPEILPLAITSAVLDYIWGSRAKKSPKEGRFVDTESVHKTLKIFNLTLSCTVL